MRKTGRNPEHASVLTRQSHTLTAPEGRGTSTEVDGNVQDLPLYHSNEFSLWMLHLIVQASQNVAGRAGMIILHKIINDSGLRHDPLVIALKEKPALIAEHARLQNESAGKRSRNFRDSTAHGSNRRTRFIRIPSLAAVGAGKRRNYYSSWMCRFSPPDPQ